MNGKTIFGAILAVVAAVIAGKSILNGKPVVQTVHTTPEEPEQEKAPEETSAPDITVSNTEETES